MIAQAKDGQCKRIWNKIQNTLKNIISRKF